MDDSWHKMNVSRYRPEQTRRKYIFHALFPWLLRSWNRGYSSSVLIAPENKLHMRNLERFNKNKI